MPDIIEWSALLVPGQVLANPTPYSRGGGTSIGGITRTIKTDAGWWSIGYRSVLLRTAAQRRAWNATRVMAGGRYGLLAVPVFQRDLAPKPINVMEMAAVAERGATTVVIRVTDGLDDITGMRFSYQHALYEIGLPDSVDDDEWTVPIFPPIRQEIPEDAALVVDVPTCLVHLATDNAMDSSFTAGHFDLAKVDFLEATDYWADL